MIDITSMAFKIIRAKFHLTQVYPFGKTIQAIEGKTTPKFLDLAVDTDVYEMLSTLRSNIECIPRGHPRFLMINGMTVYDNADIGAEHTLQALLDMDDECCTAVKWDKVVEATTPPPIPEEPVVKPAPVPDVKAILIEEHRKTLNSFAFLTTLRNTGLFKGIVNTIDNMARKQNGI